MNSAITQNLRRFFATEASWRRPDPVLKCMIDRLSFLYAVGLYELSASDRLNLARFYASMHTTATFIVFRTAEEALVQLSDAAREEADASALTTKTLNRIFTEEGCMHLLRACDLYTAAQPEEVAELRHVSRILAVASVKITEATRQLKDFDAMLSYGAELAQRDPQIATQPPVIQAWIAKHWQFCGGLLEKAYGSWYVADQLQSASRRVTSKILSQRRE